MPSTSRNGRADVWKWKLDGIPWSLLAEQVECLWRCMFRVWISCLWFLWPLNSNMSNSSVTSGWFSWRSPLAVNLQLCSVEMLELMFFSSYKEPAVKCSEGFHQPLRMKRNLHICGSFSPVNLQNTCSDKSFEKADRVYKAFFPGLLMFWLFKALDAK